MDNERSIRVLEYDKIRQNLAGFATSAPGKDRCLQLLPMTLSASITHAQEETAEAYEAIIKIGTPPLFGIREQKESFSRLRKGGSLRPGALLSIGDLLRACGEMKHFFGEDEEGLYPRLEDLIQRLVPLSGIREEIFRIILSEEEIADDATPALRRIRHAIQRKEGEVKDKLQQFLRSPDQQKKLRELLVTVRDGRYVLPVKAEARGHFPGIVHDQSASRQTVYIEPMAVVTLNNEIRQLLLEEEQEIERILRELSDSLAGYTEELEQNQEIMTELDFLFAKGRYAFSLRGEKPTLRKNGRLCLKQARHPLLDPKTVVPIDVELGESFTALIITGPNTGGKTVTLKTIGLCCMMAQAGLHIPTDREPELPIYDAVYSDIGDEQSIEQSLSTFSSHMTNIVRILEKMTDTSLILLDELGAGTDPIEGAALAMSILEELLHRKIHTVATTHYSQLKLFALNTEGVRNASMEFDLATLRPTYRLQIGLPGKSNAFEISKRLGLPDHLIEKSREKISSENQAFEDVLSRIEKEQQIAEQERIRQEQLRDDWQKKQDALDTLIQKNTALREKEIRKGQQEADRLIEEARAEVQRIIADLKQSGKDSHRAAAHAQQALREQEARFRPKEKPLKKKSDNIPENLRLGETVEVLTMGDQGEVLTLPDNAGQVTVQIGLLKVTVGIDEIRRVEKEVKKTGATSTKKLLQERSTQSAGSTLDLRGLRVDEALMKTDQFLDASILSNVERIEIIHGKGTGQLRQAITEYLREHPQVRKYRLGTPQEGGDGVTIAEL
jgi:DNA mismatch repair protein MutS2